MRVFDCFTFYKEFELLELRLKSLYNVVDYFVIVEASKTQSGFDKPFFFYENRNRFADYLPKIRNIMLNVNMEIGLNDWSVENGQRNAIMNGLEDTDPEDLIFISDLDEIPDPNIVNRLKNNEVNIISLYPLINTPPPC